MLDSEVETALVEKGDHLMAEATRAVPTGQEEVHGKLPKVGKRRSGSHRKHQSSPAYVRLAQEMRMALRMARSIKEGHKVGWRIARWLKMKVLGIKMPCLANEGEELDRKDWLGHARVSEKRTEEQRSRPHGDPRQQMKKQRAERGLRLTRMMEQASEEGGGERMQPYRMHSGRGGMEQLIVLWSEWWQTRQGVRLE